MIPLVHPWKRAGVRVVRPSRLDEYRALAATLPIDGAAPDEVYDELDRLWWALTQEERDAVSVEAGAP